ncbi:MAG TPA: type II toxin-antitoxin system VapC family toxin [Rhizomicrobium sp.]
MIVVDASAVIAILNRETNFETIVARLLSDSERRISPISAVEVVMVLARKYDDPVREAEAYLRQESIAIDPIDGVRTEWAQYAFLTYGKGRHPARLNLSDCFSYAAAKALNASLLFVGNDFSKTDLRTA